MGASELSHNTTTWQNAGMGRGGEGIKWYDHDLIPITCVGSNFAYIIFWLRGLN